MNEEKRSYLLQTLELSTKNPIYIVYSPPKLLLYSIPCVTMRGGFFCPDAIRT